VYGPENQLYADQTELEATLEARRRFSHPHQQELLQSFAETYWEYCYAWCPVLDRDTLPEELARSPLLANALALAASHIQPPLVRHAGPETYYKRARNMFYNDEEVDGLMTLKALALFYWWAPKPPATVHRESLPPLIRLAKYEDRSNMANGELRACILVLDFHDNTPRTADEHPSGTQPKPSPTR